MSDHIRQEQAQLAARLALEGLAPLCGSDVDASRVALLQPLVATLLLQGEQLARMIEPAVEPYLVSVVKSGGKA